jgi:hypothetical protein
VPTRTIPFLNLLIVSISGLVNDLDTNKVEPVSKGQLSDGIPSGETPLARPFPQAEREKIEGMFSKQQLSDQPGLVITAVKNVQA